MRSFLLTSALALALVPAAHSASVYPTDVVNAATFNWSTGVDGLYLTADDVNLRNRWGVVGPQNGGLAEVSGDFGRAGNGSLRLSANAGGHTAKAGVAFYPGTQQGFGPFSSITAASFDWMRATGSAATDEAPVMRLYLFDAGTDNHRATLIWKSDANGVTIVDDAWTTTNVMSGTVYQTRGAGPQPNAHMSFTAAQADADFRDLIVRAVEVGFGSGGWGTSFVGAVDQVTLTGSAASVSANFEMTPPPPPPPTAVPTMGLEGLLGMSAALGVAAWLRRRTRTRRD